MKYEIEVDGQSFEVESDSDLSPEQISFYAQKLRAPAQPEKKPLTLASAAFPNAQGSAPNPIPYPMSYGVLPKDVTYQPPGGAGVIGDALSLPTRAAGTAGGLLGYSGATGGKQGLEALASPETGLLKPLRDEYGRAMREAAAGGPNGRTLGDYAQMGAAGLGTLVASAAEDPTTWLAPGAKPAGEGMAKLTASIKKPLTEAAEATASGLRAGADRIQQTVLRPRAGDWDAGVDMANVSKYGVQGTVDDVIAKSQAKIDQTAKQLKTLIQEGKDGGARVNLFSALDKAQAKLKKEAPADLASKLDPIFNEFRVWAKTEANREGKNRIGAVDLLKAQEFKQMMGTHGAWEKVASKTRQNITEPERYRSRAAQAVYMALKDEIEKAAPEGVKDLNKTLSDLIPIRNAATYRKIVQDRNNPIGLSDMLSVMTAVGNGPAGAAMLLATRFTKSGIGAKTLYSMAERLQKAKTPAEAAFYSTKLKAIGLSAAEIDAIKSGFDLSQFSEAPLRNVAERDTMKQPQASR